MNQFQEPGERPAVVTRDYVLGMLSRIFGRFSPAHLISPWLDYLEAKGVVTRDGEGYELPGEAGALAAFPEDAQRSLHNAIVSHARSAACPPLLKYAIPAPPSGGGSGGSSQSGPRGIGARNSSLTTSQPDYTKAIERICWDRNRHLKDLAGFGAHAPDLFDWILKTLRETSSLARDHAEEQRAQEEERIRQINERWEARRRRLDEAIDKATVPMLAGFWHTAVENLCAPTGNPMDHDLHVLWRTSDELAVAAEALAKPRRSLLAMRAATIGLPGDVNLARNCFAADPTLVRLRTDAAIEIGEILVAWELRERGGNAKPEAIPKVSTLAPTTNPTSREMLIGIHKAAKVLTGSLRTLIELIRECPQVGVGLLRLDLHLHLPDGEDPDPGEPERAARWRAAIAPLKADLGNAAIGWSEVTDGPDRSLQRVLTASGKGASCGPIECPSYHELVIVLGRGILDPTSFKDADREPLGTKGSVARLRAVGALTDGNPWREIIDGLDREFEKALGLLPQEAGTGRLVPEVRGEGDHMTQGASAIGTPTEAPQVPSIVSARLEHDAPPSQAHPSADTKHMIGWHEILMALGRDPSSRRDKDRVRRLNNDTNGPIKRTGKRSVIANHGELLAWWQIAASRAEEMAHARAIADKNHSVIDRTLSNPGVRKDEGFHAKERPNRRNGGGR